MTNEEIKEYEAQLRELTKPANPSHIEIIALGRKVGAATLRMGSSGSASPSEIICNIHQALQTASAMNMCESAAKGYKIAEDATKAAVKSGKTTATVAVISLIIAGVSALAAWAAVIVGICK